MAADTEVGGLVVKMKADLTDYMQKLNQMEGQTKSSTDKVSDSFNGISSVMLKASTAITGAALTAIHSAMNWGEAVDDLSDKTGMAAEESSKLLVIAKRVGIGTEEAGMMFARFARSAYEAAQAQADAKASGEESTDAYKKLGVSLLNDNDVMKDASQIFSEVKNKISEMPDGLAKTATEMEIFGRSGTKMHDLLNMTNEEMQRTIDKAEQMGLILSSASSAAWEKFKRDADSTKLSIASFGISIGNEAMPQLKELLNSINGAAKAFTNLDPETKQSIMSIIKYGIEVGVTSSVILKVGGAIGGAVNAIRLLTTATTLAAGPWVTLAAAIALATPKLKEWNEESQRQKEVQAGGRYVVVGNHTEFQKTTDQSVMAMMKGDYESSEARNNPAYLEGLRSGLEKEKAQKEADEAAAKMKNALTGKGGGTSSKSDSKTAFQEYQDESSKLMSMWQDMVNLNEISRSGYRDLLNERLAGLEAIVAGEDEELDKQQAVKSLQAQLLSIDKEIRQDVIETAAKRVALGEITIEQYVEEIKKAKEAATTEQEQLDLAQRLAQENDKLIADYITAQERLTASQKDALSLQEEASRHNLQMEETFSADTLSAKRADWEKETALKRSTLDAEYAAELDKVTKTINLYAELRQREGKLTQDEQKAYDNALEQKRSLDAKYILNKEQLENSYAEKVASQQRQIIDANNDMISSLILNTKSGHDILSDMWTDFVKQTVAKLWSINSETNIFTMLLGGLFGGSGGTITSGNDSGFLVGSVGTNSIGARASGGPVSADTTYLVGEKGPELFKPSYNGTIIPNSAITSGGVTQANSTTSNTVVNVTQNFEGQQDEAVIAKIKDCIPYIKHEIKNSIDNDTFMRNSVRNATK